MNETVVEGLQITQEELDALKAKHGALYRGSVKVTPPDGDEFEVVFLFRRPRHKDSELMAQKSRTNPAAANRNLLSGVIVHPSGAEVLQRLHDAPIALAAFVDGELVPFLGGTHDAASAPV